MHDCQKKEYKYKLFTFNKLTLKSLIHQQYQSARGAPCKMHESTNPSGGAESRVRADNDLENKQDLL